MLPSQTILRIDASARRVRSITRTLADRFLREWALRRPDDPVLRRDVGAHPPPPVSEDWIEAAFVPRPRRTENQRSVLSYSDMLIEELRRADILLVATPIYNYGMPAPLKAWVDQLIRVNETFSFDRARGDWPLEPVLSGKTMVLLTSAGEFGYAPGGPRAHMDHLIPHLQTCAPYLGVTELRQVRAEYQEFADERHRRSIAEARAQIARLVEELTNPSTGTQFER